MKTKTLISAILCMATGTALADWCQPPAVGSNCPPPPRLLRPVNVNQPGTDISLYWQVDPPRYIPDGGWEEIQFSLDQFFSSVWDSDNLGLDPANGCAQTCISSCCQAGIRFTDFADSGATVWYRVRRCDQGPRCGPWSAGVWFKNGPSAPPGPVALYKPVNRFVAVNGCVAVQFTLPDRAERVEIQVASDAAFANPISPPHIVNGSLWINPFGVSIPDLCFQQSDPRDLFIRGVGFNDLGSSVSATAQITNGIAEKCAQISLGTGNGVIGSVTHVDSCYDADADEYLLVDKSRQARYANAPGHQHGGAMPVGSGSARDFWGIRSYDWRLGATKSSPYDLVWRSPDNIWSGTREMESALSANQNAELFYDLIWKWYGGWNSFDNKGTPGSSYTEVATIPISIQNPDCPFVGNASYDDGAVLYGLEDSAGRRYSGAADIVAHEWCHGVTEFGSHLNPWGESGALDEAFSDWCGVVMDYTNRHAGEFIIGEQLAGPGILRSLVSPHTPGFLNRPQPEIYLTDKYWWPAPGQPVATCAPSITSCDPFPKGNNDFCGKHINMGVLNKMFALLSLGDVDTPPLSGISVQGIGIENAFRIAFKANTERFWPRDATFQQAAAGMILASQQLFGEGSFEEAQTRLAAQAVGITINGTPVPQPTPVPTPTPPLPTCFGDCNGDREVTVDELLLAVNIAIGNSPVYQCSVADINGDGDVTVDELIRLVNISLNGCPTKLPVATSDATVGVIVNVVVDDVNSSPGSTINIPIKLTGGQNQVAGLGFDLTFPETILSSPVCDLAPGLTGFGIGTNVLPTGQRRYLIMDLSSTTSVLPDGPIMVCSATVLSTATPGSSYSVLIDRVVAANGAGHAMTTVTRGGFIFITAPPLPQYNVGGKVTYRSTGTIVPGATVQMTGTYSTQAVTDPTGQYTQTVPRGPWLIQPRKFGDTRGSITSLDAVYVLQMATGSRAISGTQLLACDVSGDGRISALDAALILQYAVGKIDKFPAAQLCGSDWLFVPFPAGAQNQFLQMPRLGNGNCQAGGISFNPLAGNAFDQNFLGILIGDCSGNWTPSPIAGSGSAASLEVRR